MVSAQGSGIAGFFTRMWRVGRWLLLILVILYAGLIVWRLPGYNSEQRSKEVVAQIHSQRLTLEDADGKHLPPVPDPAQVDATVEGIDANNNGIRDDVELAIFKKYPNSPYTRTAELQYAMTEQMFLTKVFDTETWKAVAEENGRANLCLSSIKQPESGAFQEEVEALVFNTSSRKSAEENAYEFITSHGSATGTSCDIDAAYLSK